jgi:FemAB-related protein (PEP-CTERM system-associated)
MVGTTRMQLAATALAKAAEVRVLRPEEEQEADRFVLSSSLGTCFHLSEWRTIVKKSLGHDSTCLASFRESRITGVFPFAHVRNPIFGDCLVSMPLAVYGGVCTEDEESWTCLHQAGAALAQQRKVKYLEMRNCELRFASDLPGRSLYVTFTQDLSPGPEKLLAGLPRDTRYMVRKSQKAGLRWTEDLTVDEFYEIYAHSVHRLGTPVFSKRLFSSIRDAFGAKCRLFGVRKGTQAVAGVLCLYFQDRVLPYYGGSLAKFNRDAPNNFMYWSLIEQSCAEGFRLFDFGRSKRGTGAFQFKSSWGMKVAELPYRYQLVRAAEVPHMSPVDQKFQLPVAAWKRMPFALTKIIGPQLIRWIPSV